MSTNGSSGRHKHHPLRWSQNSLRRQHSIHLQTNQSLQTWLSGFIFLSLTCNPLWWHNKQSINVTSTFLRRETSTTKHRSSMLSSRSARRVKAEVRLRIMKCCGAQEGCRFLMNLQPPWMNERHSHNNKLQYYPDKVTLSYDPTAAIHFTCTWRFSAWILQFGDIFQRVRITAFWGFLNLGSVGSIQWAQRFFRHFNTFNTTL